MSFQIPPGVVDQIRSEVFNFVLNPKPRIQSWFSGLQPGSFEITGNLTSEYNCIAWAAEDTDRWWWPVPPGVWYWPDGVPEEETLEAFVQAYATLGYVPCDIACDEKRYENIAIYVKEGKPSHAARQRSNGRWTSKLGHWERIEHDFNALEGNGPSEYGQITQIMRRRRKKTWPGVIGWLFGFVKR